ncbi:protein l(2)37Cc [Trichonephila inaurata madagascariensis]|uniref:Prohibitin n=1 Tax=Trichonephila inaurata madagascariensis TaxID=2747483 RepID=A0A8X6J986_9ARAC|nr:protein l(2)37Cc [Trichonephila inaurata madagascariensis]
MAAQLFNNIGRLGLGLAIAGGVVNSALYTVDGGHRAVIFDRFVGVKPNVVGEGTHFLIPWVQKPIIFDVRSRPRNIPVITGSKGNYAQRLPDIGNDTSDLKYLGITVLSKDCIITIKNLYHPPNSQHLNTNMMKGLFDDNTIMPRALLQMQEAWSFNNLVNDKAFLCLNDGTRTFRSNSYGSTDISDLTFISPGLFP